jgi:hypothetical protein
MTREQLSPRTLLAGVLGITLGSCSGSNEGAPPARDMQRTGGSPGNGTGGSFASGGGSGQPAASGQSGRGAGAAPSGGSGSGGSPGAGGSSASGGAVAAGGSGDTGGMSSSGGAGAAAGSGGALAIAGAAGAGGRGSGGLGPAGGNGSMAAGAGGRGGAGATTCTPSTATGTNAMGSGAHDVTVETNAAAGINEGTIFRPKDLGGGEKYPILVWGQGACSQDGLANATAMAEIASHGYFVVADGTPNGSGNREMDRSNLAAMAAPLIAYIDWAIAENEKPCSAYYQSLDPTKISANGFSCGGLMSQATVIDPRITTWGVTSSGMAGANQDFYDLIHTPVLFVEGGPEDIAYDGGLEGYEAIAQLDVPVLWFSADRGHGGDLFESDGGDFTKINLAWLNWWLKGDETATGKGLLVGAGCPYCSDAAWEVKSANVP